MKVTLGKRYKDSISGFSGVAVARATYLYGCVRVLIAPAKLTKDGDWLPDTWLDEPQLVSVRAAKVIKPKKAPSGGPPRSFPGTRDPNARR